MFAADCSIVLRHCTHRSHVCDRTKKALVWNFGQDSVPRGRPFETLPPKGRGVRLNLSYTGNIRRRAGTEQRPGPGPSRWIPRPAARVEDCCRPMVSGQAESCATEHQTTVTEAAQLDMVLGSQSAAPLLSSTNRHSRHRVRKQTGSRTSCRHADQE